MGDNLVHIIQKVVGVGVVADRSKRALIVIPERVCEEDMCLFDAAYTATEEFGAGTVVARVVNIDASLKSGGRCERACREERKGERGGQRVHPGESRVL